MQPGRAGPAESAERTRVLIVDDEPHIVEFLQMGFEYEGFAVAVAASGDEALHVAATHRPDIVILDLMLPGISGLEVARRLRRGGDVAIIMLT
ncbi:MAG: response regulator, partial [Ktedonobacterales bacterium]